MEYILVDDFETNLQTLKQAVAIVYPSLPILQKLCICQAILESNLLRKPSELAMPPNNNLFGIKAEGTDGFVYFNTQEEYNGRFVTVKAGFGKNDNLIDSVRQHRHVLELDRYKNLWSTTDFVTAANLIRTDGYATDLSYSTSLINIYNQYLV